jgi:threonine dehydratase
MSESSIAVPDAVASPNVDSRVTSASDSPRPTTIIEAPRLAEHLGLDVLLATETFQRTGSFKFRAAFNVAANVPHPHVITASSGNFGQAMAYACKLFGKRCTIVMPANSARVKVDAVLSYGGRVDLVDTTKAKRAERVAQLAASTPTPTWQARTTTRSSLPATRRSATSSPASRCRRTWWLPGRRWRPNVRLVQAARRGARAMAVVGAEPLIANDAARSLRAGHIVSNESEPQTIADGTRTLSLGKHNWEILKDGIETIVEVPEDAIREGVRLLFALANLKAEPTGALGIGALLTSPETFRDRRVLRDHGGNVDPAVYSSLRADEVRGEAN